MNIVDYLGKEINRTKAGFSSNKGTWLEYLKKYELKNYFSEDVPADDRSRLEGALEKKLNERLTEYDRELGGVGRKVASKGLMATAVLNDLYAYVSNVPIANVTGLGYALFAIKSISEVPAIYNYMKKSGDWYGTINHLAMKPIRYLLPVVGPALESGAFERMVRKRIMKETKADFIKEFGNYSPVEDRVYDNLKLPVRESVYIPEQKAA